MKETDNHHLFYTRASWNSSKINKLVRNEPRSQIEMHVPSHRELHRHVEPLTPPVIREMSERVLWLIRGIPTRYTALESVKYVRDELEGEETDYISKHLDRQIEFIELSTSALKRTMIT